MNDDDGALRGCVYVAFHHSAAHSKSFAESLEGVLRYHLRPTPMGEVDRPPARSRRLRPRITLRRQPPDRSAHQRARQRTQNEEPAPSRIWKRLSATMGESPCCLMIALLILEFLPARMGAVKGRGRQNATHTRSQNPVEIRVGRDLSVAAGPAPTCSLGSLA